MFLPPRPCCCCPDFTVYRAAIDERFHDHLDFSFVLANFQLKPVAGQPQNRPIMLKYDEDNSTDEEWHYVSLNQNDGATATAILSKDTVDMPVYSYPYMKRAKWLFAELVMPDETTYTYEFSREGFSLNHLMVDWMKGGQPVGTALQGQNCTTVQLRHAYCDRVYKRADLAATKIVLTTGLGPFDLTTLVKPTAYDNYWSPFLGAYSNAGGASMTFAAPTPVDFQHNNATASNINAIANLFCFSSLFGAEVYSRVGDGYSIIAPQTKYGRWFNTTRCIGPEENYNDFCGHGNSGFACGTAMGATPPDPMPGWTRLRKIGRGTCLSGFVYAADDVWWVSTCPPERATPYEPYAGDVTVQKSPCSVLGAGWPASYTVAEA